MNKREALALAASIFVCLGIGALGGLATSSSVASWYPPLEKPPWNPPSSVFAPVWTTLYIMMGIAYWQVWRRTGLKTHASRLFALQLALNLVWSFLFFGLKMPAVAFVEILVLWVAIAATILEFRRHSRLASALLVPYLLWVSYATTLNAAIAWLNR